MEMNRFLVDLAAFKAVAGRAERLGCVRFTRISANFTMPPPFGRRFYLRRNRAESNHKRGQRDDPLDPFRTPTRRMSTNAQPGCIRLSMPHDKAPPDLWRRRRFARGSPRHRHPPRRIASTCRSRPKWRAAWESWQHGRSQTQAPPRRPSPHASIRTPLRRYSPRGTLTA